MILVGSKRLYRIALLETQGRHACQFVVPWTRLPLLIYYYFYFIRTLYLCCLRHMYYDSILVVPDTVTPVPRGILVIYGLILSTLD